MAIGGLGIQVHSRLFTVKFRFEGNLGNVRPWTEGDGGAEITAVEGD